MTHMGTMVAAARAVATRGPYPLINDQFGDAFCLTSVLKGE
jgi:O-methyltransferase involved in polyketide biosynthesis